MYLDSLTTSQPPPRIHLTWFLITLNFLVYAIIYIHGGPSLNNLIALGAKDNGLIAEGQFFRIVSPIFLHGNLLHLLLNMFSLYQIGKPLEQALGYKAFVIIYLGSGITGNCASFCLNDHVSVGASGSIFGTLTALWILEKFQKNANLIENKSSSLGSLILAWIVVSFIIPQLDWASHLGGALSGILITLGTLFNIQKKISYLKVVRYLIPGSKLPSRGLLYEPNLYFFILLLLNAGLMMRVPYIPFKERVLSLGRLEAALDSSENRRSQYIKQFESLFSSKNSDVYILKLLLVGKKLQLENNWQASKPLINALLSLQEIQVGDEDFLSLSSKHLLVDTLKTSSQFIQNDLYIQSINGNIPSLSESFEVCYNAGELMNNLSFFSLSGKFFECSYFVNGKPDKKLATKIVKSYLKSRKIILLNNFLTSL